MAQLQSNLLAMQEVDLSLIPVEDPLRGKGSYLIQYLAQRIQDWAANAERLSLRGRLGSSYPKIFRD